MRHLTIILAAVAVIMTAEPAYGHLVDKVSTHQTPAQRLAHITHDLNHSVYVCKRGSGEPKRWHCAAAVWIRKAAEAAKALLVPPVNYAKWDCIHRHERNPAQGWATNTGNGFYGGLQMNWQFMLDYGSDFMRRWGTADRWPPWAQITAAERAYRTRGFTPWPHTARVCGLL